MKKVIAMILAVTMILILPLFAFAEEDTDSQQITVSYTASESYVVTIPSSQSFSAGDLSKTGIVSANVLLSAGKVLKVNMNSANNFALKCGSSSIVYTVSVNGVALENGSTVLEIAAGSTSDSAELNFATTEANIEQATVAGEHTDIITFSCSLESNTAN